MYHIIFAVILHTTQVVKINPVFPRSSVGGFCDFIEKPTPHGMRHALRSQRRDARRPPCETGQKRRSVRAGVTAPSLHLAQRSRTAL